jgi:hypothetical protein
MTVLGQSAFPARVALSNPPPAAITVPAHVVSVSKQITVFADDQNLAAGLAAFADKVRGRLRSRLVLRDSWRHPIVIVVRVETNAIAQSGSRIKSSVYRSDRGLKYQLGCTIPPPIAQEEFLSELVKAFCFEIANRSAPADDEHADKLASPPLWFTEGMTQNLMGDMRGVELDLVGRSLRTAPGADLEAVFATEQLPPAGIERQLFKTKCKLLIRALGALPDGPRRAQRFLTSLRPDVSWRKTFQSVYGDVLTDPAAAEQWWTARLKERAAPSPIHRLSAAETDEKLKKILTLEAVHRDAETGREVVKPVAIPELKGYMDEPGTMQMVEDRMLQLEKLQLIAHQSYLPAIAAYIEVFHHVRLDRFRKLSASLRGAESALHAARQQNSQIAETLDKIEAEQVNRELLFLYRDYFQTFEEIKTIEQSRDNAIKDYLDRFQSNAPPATAVSPAPSN